MKEDSKEKKKHRIHFVVGNDGMENIFRRIKSKKFIGFSGGSESKKRTVGSNDLKNNKKNN